LYLITSGSAVFGNWRPRRLPDKFMDAMGFGAENIAGEGGETVDYWPVDG